ncbi:MAG: anti-sigma factor, partial [Chloroflexota bacterium]|nr:anti-sigma factor [Chloroflexota bacterium]
TQVAVPPQVDARQPRTATRPVVIPASQQRSTSPILLGALGVLATLGFLWALAQRDQLATRDTEIDALRTRVAELSVAGNANVFVLNPASEAGSGAKATIFYSPGDGTVLLDARGLPELEEDRVYQVWFAAAGTDAWRAGPIFTVNQSGDAVRRLPGDVTDFGRMAISDEPAPGSTDAPDEFLLLGELVVATQ